MRGNFLDELKKRQGGGSNAESAKKQYKIGFLEDAGDGDDDTLYFSSKQKESQFKLGGNSVNTVGEFDVFVTAFYNGKSNELNASELKTLKDIKIDLIDWINNKDKTAIEEELNVGKAEGQQKIGWIMQDLRRKETSNGNAKQKPASTERPLQKPLISKMTEEEFTQLLNETEDEQSISALLEDIKQEKERNNSVVTPMSGMRGVYEDAFSQLKNKKLKDLDTYFAKKEKTEVGARKSLYAGLQKDIQRMATCIPSDAKKKDEFKECLDRISAAFKKSELVSVQYTSLLKNVNGYLKGDVGRNVYDIFKYSALILKKCHDDEKFRKECPILKELEAIQKLGWLFEFDVNKPTGFKETPFDINKLNDYQIKAVFSEDDGLLLKKWNAELKLKADLADAAAIDNKMLTKRQELLNQKADSLKTKSQLEAAKKQSPDVARLINEAQAKSEKLEKEKREFEKALQEALKNSKAAEEARQKAEALLLAKNNAFSLSFSKASLALLGCVPLVMAGGAATVAFTGVLVVETLLANSYNNASYQHGVKQCGRVASSGLVYGPAGACLAAVHSGCDTFITNNTARYAAKGAAVAVAVGLLGVRGVITSALFLVNDLLHTTVSSWVDQYQSQAKSGVIGKSV